MPYNREVGYASFSKTRQRVSRTDQSIDEARTRLASVANSVLGAKLANVSQRERGGGSCIKSSIIRETLSEQCSFKLTADRKQRSVIAQCRELLSGETLVARAPREKTNVNCGRGVCPN